MSFDFNKNLQRRQNSQCEKWHDYPENVLPLWVADSDYAAPPAVCNVLKKRLEHPVLGYENPTNDLRKQIQQWLNKRHHWQINTQDIIFVPGVVPAVNALRLFANRPAVVCSPVYPHLHRPSGMVAHKTFAVPMLFDTTQKRYTPDFAALENTIVEHKAGLLILCNPHNPLAICYNEQELKQFAKLASQYDLLICSDDIHADFAFDSNTPYRPLLSVAPEVADRTVTLMAGSKTFNIAGLNTAYAIITDTTLRKRFEHFISGMINGVNILGLIALETAYKEGENWHDAQLNHLKNNIAYAKKRLADIPLLDMPQQIEATYLLWIDASALAQKLREKGKNDNPQQYLCQHGVALSDGEAFLGKNFVRMNVATSSEILQTAFDRIASAIAALNTLA